MKSYLILGDLHANYQVAFKLAEANPSKEVIQLGDFGVGFKPLYSTEGGILVPENRVITDKWPVFPPNLKFIPGNHESLELYKKHPNCLGRFGEYKDFFFVGGAQSIDKNFRTEGVSYWPDEELSYEEGQKVIDLWTKSDKEIVLSHDLPEKIAQELFLSHVKFQYKSITRNILQRMFEIRRPRYWFAAHWHQRKMKQINSTVFTVLAIEESLSLKIADNGEINID